MGNWMVYLTNNYEPHYGHEYQTSDLVMQQFT